MSEEVCVEGGREGLVKQETQAKYLCGGYGTCISVGGTVSA